MLQQISEPKCLPISLVQARKHLAVDSSDRSNDILIDLLIQSATADSQMKTGRQWVECDWQWIPDLVSVNSEIQFPLVPVTAVKLYDLDENFEDPEDPDQPDDPEPDLPEEEEQARRKRRLVKLDDEQPEYTNLADEYLIINYPSPDPLGTPSIGSVIPLKEFPKNYQLILTVGYPTKEYEEVAEQFDNPVLVKDKTSYGDQIIRLVFNRPVQGNIYPENFEVRINGERKIVNSAYFVDECIELSFNGGEDPAYVDGDKVAVSFFEGAIYDEFQNFVQPIVNMQLPDVQIVTPEYFNTPDPLPLETVYESLAPSPIKNWILVRVGTLYTQRTEIALRAGKSNDVMFPNEFINNLLDPYRVRFFG